MEPEPVSSSSTLHFATEAEEVIVEESVVLLEDKREEEAIASMVALEAFKIAEVNHIQVEEPKCVCIFLNDCFMFHVIFFGICNFYGFLVSKA